MGLVRATRRRSSDSGTAGNIRQIKRASSSIAQNPPSITGEFPQLINNINWLCQAPAPDGVPGRGQVQLTPVTCNEWYITAENVLAARLVPGTQTNEIETLDIVNIDIKPIPANVVFPVYELGGIKVAYPGSANLDLTFCEALCECEPYAVANPDACQGNERDCGNCTYETNPQEGQGNDYPIANMNLEIIGYGFCQQNTTIAVDWSSGCTLAVPVTWNPGAGEVNEMINVTIEDWAQFPGNQKYTLTSQVLSDESPGEWTTGGECYDTPVNVSNASDPTASGSFNIYAKAPFLSTSILLGDQFFSAHSHLFRGCGSCGSDYRAILNRWQPGNVDPARIIRVARGIAAKAKADLNQVTKLLSELAQ